MKTFDEIRGNSLTEATAGDHEDAAHAHRTASKQPKMDLRAVKAHQKAAEHHDTAAKHLKTGNAYAAQNAHINAKNEADKAKDHGNVHSKRAHADTRAIGEGYASAAQRKAIWANKADGGKGHPDNKKEAKSADVKPEKYTDANGKTKVRMVPVQREDYTPAQKAAREKGRIGPKGEVGKREYGSDKSKRGFHKSQRGVSGKGDNRNTMSIFDRQPKTALQGNKPKGKLPEDTSAAVKAFLAKGGKIKKLAPGKAQGYHGKDDPGSDVHGLISKPDTKNMGTRKKVKSMEATQVDEISKDTKKSYIKKAADDMSKQADKMARAQRGDGKMDKAVNKFVNRRKGIARAVESVDEAKRTVTIDKPDRLASLRISKDTSPPFDNAKKISTAPTKDQFGNVIKNRAKSLAKAAAKKAGGDMGDKQKKESVNELDQKTMNSYHAKAQKSKDKATNSAVATIMRKGDHSKDLQTRNKRVKGMALAKSRTLKNIRGDK